MINEKKLKPEPEESREDSQEEIEPEEVEARKRAIESQQKEIVVFPESNDEKTMF